LSGRSAPTAVLDTHAWVWLVSEPKRLSRRATAFLARTGPFGVCPISCWEVATKVAIGKLTLDRDVRLWVRQALADERVTVAQLTTDAAVTAGLLGREGLHGDPADRLIAATALHLQVPVVTKDARLRRFRRLETVW
jgi:PIN domain nuclease of toxin-antitoxin system